MVISIFGQFEALENVKTPLKKIKKTPQGWCDVGLTSGVQGGTESMLGYLDQARDHGVEVSQRGIKMEKREKGGKITWFVH